MINRIIDGKTFRVEKTRKNFYSGQDIEILSRPNFRTFFCKEKNEIDSKNRLYFLYSQKPMALKYQDIIEFLTYLFDNTIKTDVKLFHINKVLKFLNEYKDKLILK